MPVLLLSAAVTCIGSLALGQGVLALCGARQWNWLAAPVGLAAMMLVAVPAIHVPGRAVTTAVVTAMLLAGGIALWIRRPAHRPPLADVLTGLPVALLALVPFAASGRVGALGMSFDNDVSAHLLLAEGYRSSEVASVTPLLHSYPLGPHALVATLAEGLGVRVDLAFTGMSAATLVLLAWTALACVRRARWLARVFVATVVGIPYLVAAYYGEGSFKEPIEALFVLASALILAGFQPELARRRWIPLAFVLAGAASAYSSQGFAWPALFIVGWIAGRALQTTWKAGLSAAWRELRAELVPGAIGIAVLAVLLFPQIPRIVRFAGQGVGGPVPKTVLGNLVGPLPVWEAFGVWDNPDLRFPASQPFTAGMWTAFVLALVLAGGVVMLRRGRWMLPLAAAGSIVVWAYINHTQSPYVSAKALVVAAPLLLLLASLALVENLLPRGAWSRMLAPVLALVLLARVVDSSWEALRYSKVAPTEHMLELRSLRPAIGDEPTLFLGNDDFFAWELAGSRVTAAYFAGTAEVPLRPEKDFQNGEPLDFDSITAATMNAFDWFITTRDAAASEPPPQLHLVRATRDYELWRRVGEVSPRQILAEGPNAAGELDCSTPAGKALLRAGGIAAVRAPSVEVPVALIGPGTSLTVSLTLTPGSWDLETPYTSPLPIKVTADGLTTTLPANLERVGPRWPIGRIAVSRPGPVAVTLDVLKYWLTPPTDIATPGALIATPVGTERTVPMRAACGKLVDWYRSA